MRENISSKLIKMKSASSKQVLIEQNTSLHLCIYIMTAQEQDSTSIFFTLLILPELEVVKWSGMARKSQELCVLMGYVWFFPPSARLSHRTLLHSKDCKQEKVTGFFLLQHGRPRSLSLAVQHDSHRRGVQAERWRKKPQTKNL